MADLTVIQGSFGQGRENKDDNADNAVVIAELEKWLERAKEKKAIAFAIVLMTEDDHVISQFVPARPRNAFTLLGSIHHLALRFWQERIEQR